MSLLEIAASDLGAGDLGCDRKYGHTGAMTVIKAVDQVEIPWTTTACTDCEFSGDLRLGSCGEGCRFFMPHMQPVDLAALSHGVREAVQRIAHDAIDPPHSGL